MVVYSIGVQNLPKKIRFIRGKLAAGELIRLTYKGEELGILVRPDLFVEDVKEIINNPVRN